MCIEIHRYKANDVIIANQVEAREGALPSASYNFRPTRVTDEFSGSGLYACFYKGQLQYIGKFLGVQDNWRGGNIVSARWVKHIGTLTLLTRNIGFSPLAYNQILGYVEETPQFEGTELKQEFTGADVNALCIDLGNMSSFARFKVAEDLWLNHSAGKNLLNTPVDETSWLEHFDFIYVKFTQKNDLETKDIRRIVSVAEKNVLAEIHPPANTIPNRKEMNMPSIVGTTEKLKSALDEAKNAHDNQQKY